MQLGQFCQTKQTTVMRYPPAQLTFTVPAAPALTTLCAIFSVDEEVVVGFPRSVVAGFAVLEQAAASNRNKKKEKRAERDPNAEWLPLGSALFLFGTAGTDCVPG